MLYTLKALLLKEYPTKKPSSLLPSNLPNLSKITPTEVIHEQEGSGKSSDQISTAGKKKDTASEEVPPVSTAGVHISTAGETATYSRRSAEKRKDKGKGIMTDEEPRKKSKKQWTGDPYVDRKEVSLESRDAVKDVEYKIGGRP
ncbi:hypothetical protein Tco_0453742 [Tanacetum coccineum]